MQNWSFTTYLRILTHDCVHLKTSDDLCRRYIFKAEGLDIRCHRVILIQSPRPPQPPLLVCAANN